MDKKLYTSGACRFCGQIFTLSVTHFSKDEADEKATCECRCNEAQEYQRRKESLSVGLANIEELYGENAGTYNFTPVNEITVETLKDMLKNCFAGNLRAVNFVLPDGTKGKISFPDHAIVERLRNTKVKLEGQW